MESSPTPSRSMISETEALRVPRELLNIVFNLVLVKSPVCSFSMTPFNIIFSL